MKKILPLVAIIATLAMFTSCKTNMRRDAKVLAHKTEQCFSLLGENEADADFEARKEFDECYKDIEKMMDKFDKRYKNEKSSKKFSELYIEEIRKSDLNESFKQTFEEIYSLANESE